MELPNELWLITFDLVIEEGIIRLDQCDYTTFPHIGSYFSHSAHCYQFYDSYYRLRLVCRRFNTLLGPRPWQSVSDSSSLPFPITVRSLYLHPKTLGSRHFFAETSTFRRLVSLHVDCGVSPLHFLKSSAGRAFPNVQRLILSVGNVRYTQWDYSFWNLLHSAFPFLVTFVLLAEHWVALEALQWKEGDKIVCFEQLEILYFKSKVPYLGCHFPRLRHASISGCSQPELEILIRSPHIESLLIRSTVALGRSRIDVTLCKRLKSLGFEYSLHDWVVPLGLDHPVENVWLYFPSMFPDPKVFQKLWKTARRAHRTFMEFSSSHQRKRWLENYERLGAPFGPLRSSLTPSVHGDRCLVFERERATTGIMDGFLTKD